MQGDSSRQNEHGGLDSAHGAAYFTRRATFRRLPGLQISDRTRGRGPAVTGATRFEAFVREYQDMVFATAVRLLGREADAEDIAQTVFLRAFERFAGLDGNPAAPGWLKTVAVNLCLNHLSRYRARWRFFSEMEDDAMPRLETRIARMTSAQEDLERLDMQDRLERALRRLPDHQRVPLVLFHFEDMTYQAIAESLGISLAKVKTDIHRGRDALKQELSTHGSR
jgi:RNA polymerase sigma-70 factor (ECF subfamily)